MTTKHDALASRLIEAYGCHGCKQIVTEDDFLLANDRFWCSKRKQSFSRDEKPHQDCPSWTFNGDDSLIDQLGAPSLPGVEK